MRGQGKKYCTKCKHTIHHGNRVNHCNCENPNHVTITWLVENFHRQKSTAKATTQRIRQAGYSVTATAVYKAIIRNPNLKDFFHDREEKKKENAENMQMAIDHLKEFPDTEAKNLVYYGITRYQAERLKNPNFNYCKHEKGVPLSGDIEFLKKDLEIYMKEMKNKTYPPSLELIRVTPNIKKYRDWIRKEFNIQV